MHMWHNSFQKTELLATEHRQMPNSACNVSPSLSVLPLIFPANVFVVYFKIRKIFHRRRWLCPAESILWLVVYLEDKSNRKCRWTKARYTANLCFCFSAYPLLAINKMPRCVHLFLTSNSHTETASQSQREEHRVGHRQKRSEVPVLT